MMWGQHESVNKYLINECRKSLEEGDRLQWLIIAKRVTLEEWKECGVYTVDTVDTLCI